MIFLPFVHFIVMNDLSSCMGSTVHDEDDDQHTYWQSKFRIISFVTDDGKAMSVPVVYFVPREVAIPDFIKSFNVGYYQDDTEIDKMVKWVKANSVYNQQCKAAIIGTNFHCTAP